MSETNSDGAAASSDGASVPSTAPAVAKRPRCGLVMPIATLGDYKESHWADVKAILTESLNCAGFDVALVSEADEIGTILKRIVQNLYENPLVVCDVSGRNHNVMFELGMRLAFDKATVIVTDEVTPFSFDTQVIEHIRYPRDLRYGQINTFKDNLAIKAKATYQMAATNSEFSPFLKHFGDFTAAKVETQELPQGEFLMKQMEEIRVALSEMRLEMVRRRSGSRRQHSVSSWTPHPNHVDLSPAFKSSVDTAIEEFFARIAPQEVFSDALALDEITYELSKTFPILREKTLSAPVVEAIMHRIKELRGPRSDSPPG